MTLFAELKRQNVVRVGIAYAVIGWILAQVAEFAFENFGALANAIFRPTSTQASAVLRTSVELSLAELFVLDSVKIIYRLFT